MVSLLYTISPHTLFLYPLSFLLQKPPNPPKNNNNKNYVTVQAQKNNGVVVAVACGRNGGSPSSLPPGAYTTLGNGWSALPHCVLRSAVLGVWCGVVFCGVVSKFGNNPAWQNGAVQCCAVL